MTIICYSCTYYSYNKNVGMKTGWRRMKNTVKPSFPLTQACFKMNDNNNDKDNRNSNIWTILFNEKNKHNSNDNELFYSLLIWSWPLFHILKRRHFRVLQFCSLSLSPYKWASLRGKWWRPDIFFLLKTSCFFDCTMFVSLLLFLSLLFVSRYIFMSLLAVT